MKAMHPQVRREVTNREVFHNWPLVWGGGERRSPTWTAIGSLWPEGGALVCYLCAITA
jgi:hypothetical protein